MQIPSCIQIETTNICNARCPFCAHYLMKRPIGMMTDELFNKIIDELSQIWKDASYATAIHPDLSGECFCDPKIFERFKIINERLPNTSIDIFTNGYLLGPDFREKLLEIKNIGLLRLSLNYIEGDYERNMGLRWDIILNNLRALKDMQDKYHFTKLFRVGAIDDEDNPQNNTKFINFVISEGFNNPDINKDMSYSIAFKTNWMGTLKVKNTLGINEECRFLAHLCILYDGSVSLCCYDYDGKYILGNLNKQTILEVYNGAERAKYLIGVKKDHTPCNLCNTR